MKIQIETTQKITTEKEITLPYFSKEKDGGYHYCIHSESDVTRIYVALGGHASITRSDLSSMVKEAAEGEPITADQYNEIYIKACKLISGGFSFLEAKAEPLCEEIKRQAVNDMITNDTPTAYAGTPENERGFGGTPEEQGMNKEIFDARYKK